MKKIIITIIIIGIIFGMILGIPFVVLTCRTNNIEDDFSNVYYQEKYQNPIMLNGINLVEQKISCGYAVMEMFAKYIGSDLTEKTLFDQYGKVVTSTGKSFEKEMNKQFQGYNTIMYKYLKNTDLIDKVYISLKNNMPVPIEWAARLNNEWKLHYSLIIGMDIPNNKITILNPYGYTENISVEELISRTSFKAYENMPALYKFGFAYGAFEKNCIFIESRPRKPISFR